MIGLVPAVVLACGLSIAAVPAQATTTVIAPVKTEYEAFPDLTSCLAERDFINSTEDPNTMAAISCTFYASQSQLPIRAYWVGPAYYLKILVSLA